MNRIAFHALFPFHHAMLDSVYDLLKSDHECLLTDSMDEVFKFKPNILVVADHHHRFFQGKVKRCDFCFYSAWVCK